MHIRVLLTTSGTGSRLYELTRNTNKSLLQLGDKFVINHIIDSYPLDYEFVITLGYYGQYVKDFLEIAYPDRKFIFVQVDLYEGIGSSLGYSMLMAKEHLQMPFIFHCCDTVNDPILIQDMNFNENILFGSKNFDYKSYSSINVNEKFQVTKMNDKGVSDSDYIYSGLFYMKDYEIFWNELERVYILNKNNSSLSDIHAIQIMLNKNINFQFQVLQNYFDTGNIESYEKALRYFKNNFNVLSKSNESLCFMDEFVIKFINDYKINQKRINRGKNLYPLTPKIIDSRNNFIKMEFIRGELMSDSKNYGEILNLLEWAQNNLWINNNIDEKYKICCENFYKNKTLERISKIPFLDKEINKINGIYTDSIYNLLNLIDFNFFSTNKFTKFHGDFILDNIIKKGDNDYCLLDWRHEFDSEMEYGDVYYDLAKLRHNIFINHKNMLNDLFEIIFINENEVIVDLKCNFILINQLKDFNKFLSKYNYDSKKVELITSIIWLNMAPLYEGKLREFLFYFGKLNLYLNLQDFRP